MSMEILPESSFSASIVGIDLSDISIDSVNSIKDAWKKFPVLVFKNQDLDAKQLESLVPHFGNYLKDPYIDPIDGSKYVAEVLREADEQTEIFAEGWHSDWFHLKFPPKGTMLYALEIPPSGGDTLFADQYTAYKNLPPHLKTIVDTGVGINSAKRGYAPLAKYGINDVGRSMRLKYSRSALEIIEHPLYAVHPDTGLPVINCNHGYTIGIKGYSEQESKDILKEIFLHQSKTEFVYAHKWTVRDLVLWDNRCVLHRATGGYDGFRRSLYRITVQ